MPFRHPGALPADYSGDDEGGTRRPGESAAFQGEA